MNTPNTGLGDAANAAAAINPTLALALLGLDTAISLVKKVMADSGLSAEDAQKHADAQDLQNLSDLQALLAK